VEHTRREQQQGQLEDTRLIVLAKLPAAKWPGDGSVTADGVQGGGLKAGLSSPWSRKLWFCSARHVPPHRP
jgi:hypothetical protein